MATGVIKAGGTPKVNTGGKSPTPAYITTKFSTKKNSSKTPVGPSDQDFQTFGQTIEATKPTKQEEFDIE